MSPIPEGRKPPVTKNMNIQDETMSQDTAFATENNEDNTFVFDDAGSNSPDSLTEEEPKATDSVVDEDTNNVEQKVPYSRFKKIVEERDETVNRISYLEERLQELESKRIESKPDDIEVPQEWKELYGDSEVSKRAWAIQQKREEELAERAINEAMNRLSKQQQEEVQAIAQNEETIDDNLSQLEETIGKKLSPKQEEELLTIVDEFSPVGADGKYVTLFPFDKAYEIYTLRQSQKGLGTRQARQNIADLTSNMSEGEADTSEGTFKRGWDNWRGAL